jgi:hypothetical protein
MSFEIVWEPHGVYKRYWGGVTVSEFIDSSAMLRGDRRFDSIRYVINDYLAVEGHEVSEEAIAGIAAISMHGQATNANIRIALVTTDSQIKELAWQFSSRTLASYPTQLFSTVTEARDWISRQPPLSRPKSLIQKVKEVVGR